MATASIISTSIRRPQPTVVECFRRALLHSPQPSAAAALSNSPQLVVLFTWVGAKEKYAYKFVDAWKTRGFHVLHITSTVTDLMRPNTGTEVTANYTLDFLTKREQKDYKFIIHGLSVGGYLGQRVLMGLHQTDLLPQLSYQIYDSFTQIAGFESGVQNAVHPRYKGIISSAIKLYTRMADLSCLYEVERFAVDVPAPAPTFFMHSLADKVAKYETILKMTARMARGSPVSMFILPESANIGHVSLCRRLGEGPYMSSIIRFFKRNNFAAIHNEILQEDDPKSEISLLHQSMVEDIKPLYYSNEVSDLQ